MAPKTSKIPVTETSVRYGEAVMSKSEHPVYCFQCKGLISGWVYLMGNLSHHGHCLPKDKQPTEMLVPMSYVETALKRVLKPKNKKAKKLADLVMELAESADNAHDDIGGSRKGVDILRDAVKVAMTFK